MKRLLLYSHDTYGLGNIRRMSAIGETIAAAHEDLAVLIVSGSPVPEMFRTSPRLDFVKLPCLARDEDGKYITRSLGVDTSELIRIRAELLSATVDSFRPDVIAVDKKPYGVADELRPALLASRSWARRPRLALILRDILDAPDQTIPVWSRNGYFAAISDVYDTVLVLGCPTVFDLPTEYCFPASAADRVAFCGYLARRPTGPGRAAVRASLSVADDQPLVLVTPGGGQDGHPLASSYLRGMADDAGDLRSIIVAGPEMRAVAREDLHRVGAAMPGITVLDSTESMVSLMQAADVVVSMAGYNTVCEIISTGSSAVVAPRSRPVAEQSIRATRLHDLGVLRRVASIPDPDVLADAVRSSLGSTPAQPVESLVDMRGGERVEKHLGALLGDG